MLDAAAREEGGGGDCHEAVIGETGEEGLIVAANPRARFEVQRPTSDVGSLVRSMEVGDSID